MNVVRGLLGVLLALGTTIGLGALSRAPYAAHSAEQAFVRLSWRSAGRWVSECRPRTQEEVARLPVHMRREEECERRLLPQHLAVRLDGAPVIADTVRAAGALGDRPLYVNRELRVDPGTHSLTVEFLGAGEVGDASASAGTRLALDTVLTLSPREITVITLSPDGTELVLMGR